ncbi:MAG: chorismate synthase [Desulfobacterales bacterium]|nr:chorismate synthase [Desulfobacterales bacterium]
MSSTFGSVFRVTTYGESHGVGIGAMIDGCPPRLPISEEEIQQQLDRRRPGQSHLTTPRKESDTVSILSGTENGLTLGTPIGLAIPNSDQFPKDYGHMGNIPRPSHADFTYQQKYGIRARSGGGRSSARETAARVAAGTVAEIFLRTAYNIEIVAWVASVGDHAAPDQEPLGITRTAVDASPVRCPDPSTAAIIEQEIVASKDAGDSLGGTICCVCRNVPPGLGEPVFDKMEAVLAGAMLSIPATKGFEIGSGFAGTRMQGSRHNDPFIKKAHGLGTATNHSGGIQGGITNGEPIYFKVAFKPVATIGKPQATVDFDGNPVTLEAKGRHDPCVLPRAVPIVESMAALTLADLALRQKVNG